MMRQVSPSGTSLVPRKKTNRERIQWTENDGRWICGYSFRGTKEKRIIGGKGTRGLGGEQKAGSKGPDEVRSEIWLRHDYHG